ncbi:carbamoyltransferase HypF [Halobacteriales archaeon QH_7_69_31]|nr:MAG: carbamoyltransferase HypF [Halobacteriales archaeon QH_7_69_31]
MERATVRVTGVVQSVGFRPFVYRRAVDHDLRGAVRNLGDAGVRIELEGDPDAVDALLAALREEPPPLSTVETVEVDRRSVDTPAFEAFAIVPSDDAHADDGAHADADGGTLPPDTATCDRCLGDLRDPDSRFHRYWATACVDCGPRFTVVESLPFDRPTTSMAAFPLCEACRDVYGDPADRRYHAQTMACPDCGPRLRYGTVPTPAAVGAADPPTDGRDPFPDALETVAERAAAVRATADTVTDGGIAVLKGVGGAHLACDATDPAAVGALRERTGRPDKPFAVMAPDLDAVDRIAGMTASEREALASHRRPIVLLSAAGDTPLAAGVAPGLHTVGVMLPYSGVHHLLFDRVGVPLVVTSANPPGQPMYRANGPLVAGLADVADGFLLHDRRIVSRCDDSVVRVADGARRPIRRSRGFVPTPVPVAAPDVAGPGDGADVLAVGPELDVAAAVRHDGDCYLTQHVGDVDGPETLSFLESAIARLLAVTGLEHPPVVAHDAHPSFVTTDYADRLVAEGPADRTIAVQHHHAHAASVLAEHARDRAVALTLDGVGYGPDGTVWGGEVLDASRAEYERVGGLAPVPMPGGDRATEHPARMVAGLLDAGDGPVSETLERHGVGFPGGDEERSLVVQQLDAEVNTPVTTSAGRFLDAVSALLGVSTDRSYEGEPAMRLEAVAAEGTAADIEVPTATVEGRPVVDTPWLFRTLGDRLADGDPKTDVAATAQAALARGLAGLAVDAANDRNVGAVALTGGVAYNDHISEIVRQVVEAAGLTLVGNERVPPGDGGIAYGQAVVAGARERR